MAEKKQESVKHRLKWNIDGVTREKLEKPEFFFVSQRFPIMLGDEITDWEAYIELKKEGYLCAGLSLLRADKDDLYVKLDITIHDHIKPDWGDIKIEVGENIFYNHFIAFEKLFDTSMEYLKDGSTMKLIFDIEILQHDKEETPSKNTYTKLYNDTTLADFTLISSDGEPFIVNRTVLALESEFFKTMLTIDMKEKQQGSVKFDDIESETLKEVLGFIYNNNIKIDTVEKATKVIYAAEKFNLPELKEICCETLAFGICKENIIKILTIADLYNAKELMDNCLKQIVVGFNAVKETEGWKSLTVPLLTKIAEALYAAAKIEIDIPETTLLSSL